MDFIPQIKPWIDESELEQLSRVVDSTYVTENQLTSEFEEKIKQLTGSKYVVAVTNGTAALFCALKALGIGGGDEVIVPNLTFIATSNSVLMTGAIPVFCEIKADTLCIDPEEISKLITSKTKAIIPVHLYGQSAGMEQIIKIAKDNDLKIVEDAAQGVGVHYNNKHVGTFGELGILSFYGNKTITCGEGGAVLTENKNLRNSVYRLKNHGRLNKGVFNHDSIGFNFCFTEMQAAIGISQLNKLPKIIEKKQHIYDRYLKGFSKITDILKPIQLDRRSTAVHWFTSFLTENKELLKSYLSKKNIETRDFFTPLNKQKCYAHIKSYRSYDISDKVYRQGISLPSSYDLSLEQQKYIIKTILDYFNKKNDLFSREIPTNNNKLSDKKLAKIKITRGKTVKK